MDRVSGRTTERQIKSSHLIAEQFASADPSARIAVAVLRLIFGERLRTRVWRRALGRHARTGRERRAIRPARERCRARCARRSLRRSIFRQGGRSAPACWTLRATSIFAVDACIGRANQYVRARCIVCAGALLRRLPTIAMPPLREANMRGRRAFARPRPRRDRLSLRSAGRVLPQLSRPRDGLFVRVLRRGRRDARRRAVGKAGLYAA